MMDEERHRLLVKALNHALTCPLAQDCFRIMRDEPQKITACSDCRATLTLWKIEVLEALIGATNGT